MDRPLIPQLPAYPHPDAPLPLDSETQESLPPASALPKDEVARVQAIIDHYARRAPRSAPAADDLRVPRPSPLRMLLGLTLALLLLAVIFGLGLRANREPPSLPAAPAIPVPPVPAAEPTETVAPSTDTPGEATPEATPKSAEEPAPAVAPSPPVTTEPAPAPAPIETIEPAPVKAPDKKKGRRAPRRRKKRRPS
jgi:hypothetical protein